MAESSKVLAKTPEGVGDTSKEGWGYPDARSLGRASCFSIEHAGTRGQEYSGFPTLSFSWHRPGLCVRGVI